MRSSPCCAAGRAGCASDATCKEMERLVAASFGKKRGVMVNSGSSALYLAVELLGLEPGDEIITSAVTFSTDIAPMVRAGLVPVFVDVEPDTYQIDVDAIEAAIGPRTRAILAPNLIGNCPDWDRIRDIADRHGLKVSRTRVTASGRRCGARRPGTRSDISVTSFALSHIITAAGTGGMVCVDDEALARPRRCSCAGGDGAARSSSSARRRATSASSPRSTASSTTTSSSSTRSGGTSSRPRCRPRSAWCRCSKLPHQPGASQAQFRRCWQATSSAAIPRCSCCRGSPPASRPGGTCSRS